MEENMNAPKDANQLNTFVDRIERLEEEKKELSADIRDVFSDIPLSFHLSCAIFPVKREFHPGDPI